jgi:magnesium transporter
MIVDSAIYVDGHRDGSRPLEEIKETCREKGGFAWFDLHEPAREEFDAVAGEFGLHELAVKDGLRAHQRPKVERYGETLFVVLKAARYVEEKEEVEFGEVHAFVGSDFVVTVSYGEANELVEVRRRAESEPELLRRGPSAVLYAIMDRIVEDYGPVVEGLENDIDEISDALYSGSGEGVVSRRIYQLTREVSAFHRAVAPLELELRQFLEELAGAGSPRELQHVLRDVLDHLIFVNNKVESFHSSLTNALMLDSTQLAARQNEAAIEQNEQMKRISSWAAILFAPSIIGSVYGMNFRFMPELSWVWGYPMALGLMLVTGVVLYVVFRFKRWL